MNNSTLWKNAGYFLKIWLLIIVVCIILFLLSMLIPTKYTEITDIAKYGIYEGTHNDSYVQSYINSFFPAKIEDFFEVVKYSYRSENSDTYGFEAYLEIHIEDKARFDKYVSSITTEPWQEFLYCKDYFEYSLVDSIDVWMNDHKNATTNPCYQIEYARIKKILYSPKDQIIIYVAIGVSDGGAADTEYLGIFFDRFQIDPQEYEYQTEAKEEKA